MKFCDYTFTLMSNGNIVMDHELDSTKLNVKTGDSFEVVITPDGVVVFQKKLVEAPGFEPGSS
jgi:hypothetical protein